MLHIIAILQTSFATLGPRLVNRLCHHHHHRNNYNLNYHQDNLQHTDARVCGEPSSLPSHQLFPHVSTLDIHL